MFANQPRGDGQRRGSSQTKLPRRRSRRPLRARLSRTGCEIVVSVVACPGGGAHKLLGDLVDLVDLGDLGYLGDLTEAVVHATTHIKVEPAPCRSELLVDIAASGDGSALPALPFPILLVPLEDYDGSRAERKAIVRISLCQTGASWDAIVDNNVFEALVFLQQLGGFAQFELAPSLVGSFALEKGVAAGRGALG